MLPLRGRKRYKRCTRVFDVRITPHIASMTQPQTAARVAIDNLRRFERGEPLVGLVDRGRGY
jgi:glyoxylate/hydroxypyruvate reductase A